jgi:hypothetical protein
VWTIILILFALAALTENVLLLEDQAVTRIDLRETNVPGYYSIDLYGLESMPGFVAEVSLIVDGEPHTLLYTSRAHFAAADAAAEASRWLAAYEAAPEAGKERIA